jgi:hypothetical protein
VKRGGEKSRIREQIKGDEEEKSKKGKKKYRTRRSRHGNIYPATSNNINAFKY